MHAKLAEIDQLKPRFPRFIGVDSDGCVFDTMTLKHSECFIPEIIRHFSLQSVAAAAREVAEWVNLRSPLRGSNRFPALIAVLDHLRRHPAIRGRTAAITSLPATRAWLERETRPCNERLETAIARTYGTERAELAAVLAWSECVDHRIAEIVRAMIPFDGVRSGLEAASAVADLLVISATPHDALYREWSEAGLLHHVAALPGQEAGSKKAQLARVIERGYEPQNVLLVGDAPGDLRAARETGAMFYPIVPGDEIASWRTFRETVLPDFVAGAYDRTAEETYVDRFEATLTATPPWERL